MEENLNIESLKGKNWVATLLFCWFLGLFGAHRFYTGKIASAIVMAIMTLTGIFSIVTLIWALIDGFMIAFGIFKHNDGSELYERIDWLGYIYAGLMILGLLGLIFFLVIFLAFAAGVAGGAV